jgi:hypothetical protein
MAKIRLVNKIKNEEFELKLDHKTFVKACEGDQSAIDYIKNQELPESFDWKFYIHSNKNLIKAGMNSEVHAIYHYLTQGKKRNKEYASENTNKWVFPKDWNLIFELHNSFKTIFTGSFVDYVYLEEYKLNDLKIIKDIDLICFEKPNVPNLKLDEYHEDENFDKFLEIHSTINEKPKYQRARFFNKNIDIFIIRRGINHHEFSYNDKKIKILSLNDRLKCLEAFMKNADKLDELNQNWLCEKIRQTPELIKKYKTKIGSC